MALRQDTAHERELVLRRTTADETAGATTHYGIADSREQEMQTSRHDSGRDRWRFGKTQLTIESWCYGAPQLTRQLALRRTTE
jgi:hypothetical protein